MTLAVENLCAAYGEIEVLHGVNLVVEKGEIIALLGANGAGKSTTIKAIMGLVKPSAGRILLDGRDLMVVLLPAPFAPSSAMISPLDRKSTRLNSSHANI